MNNHPPMSPLTLALLAPFIWLGIVVLTVACGLLVLVLYPFVRPVDPARHSLHAVATLWAKGIALLMPRLHWSLEGAEHLPPRGEPVVYVANHQSQTDILALFLTGARFRWLAKASLFHIPVFGWALRAIGYVPVKRTSPRSRAKSMRDSLKVLRRGVPMMFFPEGTRSPDGVLKSFKSGAFALAVEAGVPIVPITIQGTDSFLPKGSIVPHSSSFRVVVHRPIPARGRKAVELAEEVRQVIASALPPEKRGNPCPANTPLATEGAIG